MRAVWSFWSKPFYAGSGWRWREPVHHLLAWGLSLRLARSHYPETVLITDTPGKTLLINQLGLSFTHVSTELDRLQDEYPGLWALGKLVTYSLQDKPFVHLDTDVFLWRPLPGRITSSSSAGAVSGKLPPGRRVRAAYHRKRLRASMALTCLPSGNGPARTRDRPSAK